MTELRTCMRLKRLRKCQPSPGSAHKFMHQSEHVQQSVLPTSPLQLACATMSLFTGSKLEQSTPPTGPASRRRRPCPHKERHPPPSHFIFSTSLSALWYCLLLFASLTDVYTHRPRLAAAKTTVMIAAFRQCWAVVNDPSVR